MDDPVGILVIDTWPKWHFKIWPFLWFLEDKIVNLGPIDFKLGVPVNINVNDGQNKFEVHMSKNMAKIVNFQPKTGQDTTFAPTLSGHNSAIFYLILTYDHTKIISSLRRIIFLLDFGFWPILFSEASHGQYCAHGPKTTLELWVNVQAITPDQYK